MTANIRRILAQRGEQGVTDGTATRDADAATVDDALRQLRRLITTSVVNGYLSRNMQAAIRDAIERGNDPSTVDITAIRASVAALAFIDVDVESLVDDAADSLTRHWLTTKAGAIASLPDSRQPTYQAIQDMAREPERVPIEIRSDDRVDSVDTDRNPLPTANKHLLATPDGEYPLELKMARNRWERATIKHEESLGTLAGWYRNPSSAGRNSLRIAHKSGDRWRSVQPDFIFVHLNVELTPSIIDPHGAHFGDSGPKLKALAEYADEFGDLFDRIVTVGVEKDEELYGLDLKNSKIRRAVYESPADSDSIKKLYADHGTKYGGVPTGI